METETCFQETKFCFQCLMFGNENVFPGNRFPFLGMKTGFLFPMFCAIIRLHRNLFSLSNQLFTHSLTHFIGCFISPPVHFIQIITCHLKNVNLISLTLSCSYHTCSVCHSFGLATRVSMVIGASSTSGRFIVKDSSHKITPYFMFFLH